MLLSLGMEKHGNEILYNGMTGEQCRNGHFHWSCILSKIEAYGK